MASCYWRRRVFEYHPLLGWWHLPNIRARIPLGETFHLVQTNSAGMRCHREYPKSCPKGRKRIVFLGDSYTAGDGVSNKHRFTDLLEQRYGNIDALNFGLNGSGTDQQLLILENMAVDYDTDAFIFCICVENIARNLYTCFPNFLWQEKLETFQPKPYFELTKSGLHLRNTPVPKERRHPDNLGDWCYGFPYIPSENDAYAIYKYRDRPHWQLMKAILQRMIAQAKGKPVFIVPMPMYNHYLGEAKPVYLDRFQELSDSDRRIYVVDLLPAMQAVPVHRRQKLRFPNDPHYTRLAHKIVADVLENEFIQKVPKLLQ